MPERYRAHALSVAHEQMLETRVHQQDAPNSKTQNDDENYHHQQRIFIRFDDSHNHLEPHLQTSNHELTEISYITNTLPSGLLVTFATEENKFKPK